MVWCGISCSCSSSLRRNRIAGIIIELELVLLQQTVSFLILSMCNVTYGTLVEENPRAALTRVGVLNPSAMELTASRRLKTLGSLRAETENPKLFSRRHFYRFDKNMLTVAAQLTSVGLCTFSERNFYAAWRLFKNASNKASFSKSAIEEGTYFIKKGNYYFSATDFASSRLRFTLKIDNPSAHQLKAATRLKELGVFHKETLDYRLFSRRHFMYFDTKMLDVATKIIQLNLGKKFSQEHFYSAWRLYKGKGNLTFTKQELLNGTVLIKANKFYFSPRDVVRLRTITQQ